MSQNLGDIGYKISMAASEIELMRTGIEGVDNAIGGFPDKSVILLVGEPDSNSVHTFVQQVLWNRVAAGEKITYYLVGKTSLSIRQDALTYGWELEKFITDKSWNFVNVFTPGISQLLLPITPPNQEKISVEQNLNPLKRDFVSRTREGDWTSLDSATSLLHEFSSDEVFGLVRYLTAAAHIHGGVHFLIVYEGIHEEHVVNLLRVLADGVIEFSLKESAGGFEGSMLIKKMRKVYRTTILPFSIGHGGIQVETAVRIA